MSKKIILMSDKEAASIKTVTGWVGGDGRFYGDDEEMARWAGATHKQCQNQNHPPHKKNGYCIECHKEQEIRRFNSFPLVVYKDGFIYCHDNDRFYSDADYLLDSIEHGGLGENPMLSTCSPVAMHPLEIEHWEDVLPEDCGIESLPIEIADAIEALNEAIEKHGQSVSFMPNNDRIDINQLRDLA